MASRRYLKKPFKFEYLQLSFIIYRILYFRVPTRIV